MGGTRFRKVPWGRIAVVLAILVLASPLIGRWWVTVSPTSHVPVETDLVVQAHDAIGELAIVEPLDLGEYDRDFFGPAWQPVVPSTCDTRNEILKRWLSEVTMVDHHECSVESGWFIDPYTGHTVEFVRGPETSKEVHIDHVVALADAWRKGGDEWDPLQAQTFANDPLNLLPTQGWVNEEKGADDASGWLPHNEGFWCFFAVQQILVKDKYDLGVTDAEVASLRTALDTCD